MKDLKSDGEDPWSDVFRNHINNVVTQLGPLAAMAQCVGFDRKLFLLAARKAFDGVTKMRKHVQKEAKK